MKVSALQRSARAARFRNQLAFCRVALPRLLQQLRVPSARGGAKSSMAKSRALLLVFAFGKLRGARCGIDWVQQLGGPASDYGRAIAVDAVGSALSTGDFGGTGVFGSTSLTSAGEQDVVVVKTTTSGVVSWAVRAGGGGTDLGHAIAVDACDFLSRISYVDLRFPGALPDRYRQELPESRVISPRGGVLRLVICTLAWMCLVFPAQMLIFRLFTRPSPRH